MKREKQDYYNLRRTGMHYEKLAGAYLQSLGYEILEYNFRSRTGEIDIVAKDGEDIVFCEVKFRSGDANGLPEEAVDRKKQRIISKTAFYFLQRHGYDPYTTASRFDVISIEGQTIKLFKDAFLFAG